MNIAGNPLKNKKTSRWFIFSLYIIIVMASEQFFRKPLFDASISFIEGLQGSDPHKNSLMHIAEFISHLGNSGAFLTIILIVYNFANIYKTYVLLMALLLASMMISILKMIYMSPRPYWVSEKIIPFGCEGGWGNPSGHSLASTAFYISLWHILFECSQLRKRKLLKYGSLAFTILFILTIMFSRNAVGAHSLNQILFGCLLGFAIYFFLFYVLCIDVNDSKQFLKFIEFRNLIYGVINFFIFLFAILVYFFNQNEEVFAKWDHAITTHGCASVPKNKRLQNEGFVTFAVFLANFGAFMGIKFEYYFSFAGNVQNWRQFNFEVDEKNDDESLMTKISINKETQWNHTNSFYSIMRILIVLLLCAIIILPFYMFIEWDDNFAVVFLFKTLIPFNLAAFSFFFLFKIVLKSLRMVNLTLYSMLQDSL